MAIWPLAQRRCISTRSKFVSPKVQDNAPQPPGNVPCGRQLFIMLGLALVIVLAVVFSTPSASSSHADPVRNAAASAPTKSEIDRFQQQLRTEEDRLRQAQEEAARARGLAAMQQQPYMPMQGGIPGQHDVYYQPGSPAVTKPEKSAIEQEQERREYQSLFASNVALSIRPQSPPDGAEAQEKAKPAAAAGVPAPAAAVPVGPRKYSLMEGTIIE